MLKPEHRKKLDDIVVSLAEQNAPQADVEAIVNDFKAKYDVPETKPKAEQQQQQIIPAMYGAPSYAQQSDIKSFRGTGNIPLQIVKPIAKTIADVGVGVLSAPFHPIQTAKGVGLGVASMAVGSAPSYVQQGSSAYIDPLDAAKMSEGITSLAKTPQEKRGVTIGQIAATFGVNPEIKATQIASKSIPKILTGKTLNETIDQGIAKGVKPTIYGKQTMPRVQEFYDKAKIAVKTIAENKDKINLVDANGEQIQRPKTLVDFAKAIDATKKNIYADYHAMATKAGDKGAWFDANDVVNKIDKATKDKGLVPEVREYAASLKPELIELAGESPEIIERRIQHYNESLTGFYEGRVSKEKARVDASIAQAMREQLDKIIEESVGPGYQGLKNKYGALKTIEKDVNKRAVVEARKSEKGFYDISDIFTGGEIVAGVLSANPALIAKGTAGIGIKAMIKKINNPNRYIEKMFKKAYNEITPADVDNIYSDFISQVELPKNVNTPTYFREGIRPEVKLKGGNYRSDETMRKLGVPLSELKGGATASRKKRR